MCKSWPGVVVPTEETATEQTPSGGVSTSATTTTGHQEDGVMWLDPHGFLKYFDVSTLSAISVMLPRSLPL
ncbi:hypothetical protein D5086_010706 [Populus alba]